MSAGSPKMDFGIFAANFGQEADILGGDLALVGDGAVIKNGIVDILDFGLLADNYGKALTAGQGPVPEPSEVAVLVVGLLLGGRRVRPKQ